MIERSSYGRREPTATVLHAVVREHLESFLAAARERSGHGYGVPRHVERELRNYLACGILAHGFVRVRCVDCGFDRLLAFSCKGRAVCPSCRGRRMADAAAHLVDRVLPCAPYRQWTLSVPWRLRALLARDRRLLSAALTGFVRAVFRWQRAQARARGLVGASPGAVTAIQRFGSVLNLNVHFHTLVPDGVFVPDGDGGARFVPLPAPTDADVAAICARVARRILRLVDGDDGRDDDAGALLADAARSPMGTLPFAMMPPPPPAKRLTAHVDDFTLHADTAVAAYDRDGLEHLARCGARPPFAHRRLRLTPSGQVAYRLRRPWFTGQTELVLAPVAFLRRLAALIPPPRQNQTRYHGVFAANARLRAGVTALVPGALPAAASAPRPHPRLHPSGDACPDRAEPRPPSRMPWAELLRRVFREDLLVCPRCTGPMQVLATLTDPAVVLAILTHLGAPTELPAVAPRSRSAAGRPLARWLRPARRLRRLRPRVGRRAASTRSYVRAPVAGQRRARRLVGLRKTARTLTFSAGMTPGAQQPRTRARIQAAPNRVHRSYALDGCVETLRPFAAAPVIIGRRYETHERAYARRGPRSGA